MNRNKKIGLAFILVPIAVMVIILAAYALFSLFVTVRIGEQPLAIPSGSIGQRTPGEATLALARAVLSFLGLLDVIAILIGLPLGIYFLVKKESEGEQTPMIK